MPKIHFRNGVIAAGSFQTAEINVQGLTLFGIQMGSSWNSSGIGFHFLGSYDDSFMRFIRTDADPGAYYLKSYIIPNEIFRVDPKYFTGLKRLQLRSGVPGATENQTAQRIFTLLFEAD